MPTEEIPPEIQFLQSPIGGAIVVIIALAAFALVVVWARRPGHHDRWAALAAATGTSLLVILITLIAVATGWWRGAFFAIPLVVAVAIDLPLSIAGYTLWLGLSMMRARERQPLQKTVEK